MSMLGNCLVISLGIEIGFRRISSSLIYILQRGEINEA